MHHAGRQQGVVLFIALIALVTIMLAAVALMRSVDTNTVIAGNLAFKQSATASGDNGLESAIQWLANINTANAAKDAFTDLTHPFNSTNAAEGYYSNITPGRDFMLAATWADAASKSAGTDAGGNTIRYVIERMCRTANQLLSESDCLFSDVQTDTDSHQSGKQKPLKGGRHPLNRITIRVAGARNTISYIQAFVY
jgi:hypothetical protein